MVTGVESAKISKDGQAEPISDDGQAFAKWLNNLSGYVNGKGAWETLDIDGERVGLRKFAPVIIWGDGDRNLAVKYDPDQTESGYDESGHDRIIDQHNLWADSDGTWRGFVLVFTGSTVIVGDGANIFKIYYKDRLQRFMADYGLNGILGVKYTSGVRAIDPEEFSGVLFDAWALRVAKEYGLNVWEWLEYRGTLTLPDGVRPRAG